MKSTDHFFVIDVKVLRTFQLFASGAEAGSPHQMGHERYFFSVIHKSAVYKIGQGSYGRARVAFGDSC